MNNLTKAIQTAPIGTGAKRIVSEIIDECAVVVTGCSDCPFYSDIAYQHHACKHPLHPLPERMFVLGLFASCPLKDSPIVIKLGI